MAGEREDPGARRSVVPSAAGRSLWLSAAWTGIGAALVCAITAIIVVAVCWLPASAGSGSAGSTIRTGLLTWLAALHGGITVDGVPAAFLPLGMTLLVAAVAWRAGAGLADAADDLGEDDPVRLLRAAAIQAASFAVVCAVAAALSRLGSSSVSIGAALFAGLVLFLVSGGVAFVRWSALGDELTDRAPAWLGPAVRCAVAAVAVQLAAGALVVVGALLVHHNRVESLSQQVGGGWSGVPVLLLGVLAAPNAVVAAASYLAGPGFALGSGSSVTLGSTAHGTLPAFPVLGAVPAGPAGAPAWILAVAGALAAGLVVARLACRAAVRRDRWRDAGLGAAGAGALGAVLAWQGGGSIGSGRLNAVGASPWQLGGMLALEVGVVAAAALGLAAAVGAVRGRAGHQDDEERRLHSLRSAISALKDEVKDAVHDVTVQDNTGTPTGPDAGRVRTRTTDADKGDQLAG